MAFLFEVKSTYEIFETVDRVKKALKENGFGTLYELNFKDKFAEHNMTYKDNFFVLEVCNPKQAHKILDISQEIGYFLPCKVVVYESEDHVITGMMKPTSIVHMVTENMEAIQVAHDVEDIIKKSLEQAVK